MGRPKGSKNKPRTAITGNAVTGIVTMTPDAINARTIALLRALAPFTSRDATRGNLAGVHVRHVEFPASESRPARVSTILEATDGYVLAQVRITHRGDAPRTVALPVGLYDCKAAAKYLSIGQNPPRITDAGSFPTTDHVIPTRRETNDGAVAAFDGRLFARVTEGVDSIVAAFDRGHGVALRVQLPTDHLSPALVSCDFAVALDGFGVQADIEVRGVIMPMRV